MFQRLPNARGCPQEDDVSSLRDIIHGAAPCPPEVMKAMIDWVGLIINEVLRRLRGRRGVSLSRPRNGRFSPARSASCLTPARCGSSTTTAKRWSRASLDYAWLHASRRSRCSNTTRTRQRPPPRTAAITSTLGDVGYLDGYLPHRPHRRVHHLRRRSTSTRRRIDNELIKHPAVEDSVSIGVPNEEWRGGEVGGHLEPWLRRLREALAADIQTFAREHLAGFKVPRSVSSRDEPLRSPAGKIQRKKVREPFWAGRARQI